MNTSKNYKFFWIPIIIGILTALSVSAKAQEYSFKVEKSGKGQPVILIPGITCHGDVWKETVNHLSTKYECHVITLPGFAGQKAIDFGESFLPKMKTEIVQYIQSNQLNKPIIIGHSLGGFLTLDIISSQPDLASKAIIVDGLPFLGAIQNPSATEESMKEAAKSMVQSYQNMDAEQYNSQQRMMLGSMITDPKNIEVALEWGAKSDAKTVGQAMYELYSTDLRDELAQVKTLVLVLGAYIAYEQFGVTKEMTYNNFSNQFKQLKRVEIVLSDKGKHFIMWDDPLFFTQQVNRFLSTELN